MRYLHKLRGRSWLLMVVLLICGATAFSTPRVNGAAAYQEQPLVTHVLRYNSSEAGEVALIWGVNGWHMLPEAQRPTGTTIVKTATEVMQTPMKRTNGSFEVTLQLPAGSAINYLFHITQTRSGVKAEAWDLNGLPERDFYTVVVANGVTDVTPTISLGQELFVSAADVTSQWIAGLVLLCMTLLFAIIGLRFYARDPFLDF
jgi:hypothetical protein